MLQLYNMHQMYIDYFKVSSIFYKNAEYMLQVTHLMTAIPSVCVHHYINIVTILATRVFSRIAIKYHTCSEDILAYSDISRITFTKSS